MRVKISVLIEGMSSGGFLDLESGELVRPMTFDSENKVYKNNMHLVDSETHMYIPLVNNRIFIDEFIRMQNFDDATLKEYGYQHVKEFPLLIPAEQLKDYSMRNTPNDRILAYIDRIGMEYDYTVYEDIRIAGIARMWGRERGWEIIEDYMAYRRGGE